MGNFSVALVAVMLCSLAISEAAVYIGGGCYDCNPPNGQGPGIYSNGGGNGGGRGGGGGYNAGGGGGGRPVYSGNFGPNGYSGGGGGGGRGGGGYGGGGGYDDGLTQIISG